MRGILFVLTCLLAAMTPLLSLPTTENGPVDRDFPGWPTHFEGAILEPLPLPPRDAAFARTLPGRTARFRAGERQLVLRWVTTATRRLHPAADCYRGLGCEVAPRPLHVDERGRRWGCSQVVQDGTTLWIRERIWDGADRGYADVSSWYWAAMLGRTAGPWWSAVVVSASNPATPPRSGRPTNCREAP